MKEKAILELADKLAEQKINPPLKDSKVWMERSCVLAVETNNPNILNILKNYEGVEDNNTIMQVNRLSWKSRSKVNVEYLKIVLDFIKKTKVEDVELSVSDDYPVCFKLIDETGAETRVIIAPRVES